MLPRLLVACALLAFAPAALAAPPKSANKQTKERAKPPKKKTPRGLAFKALRTIIKDATFKDMTFEEFTEWLSRQTEANIVVKWKVIEEAEIDVNKLINLKLREVTIRKIIELVFEQVTGELKNVELAAKADDNTLIISTKRDLYKELVTRTYDIQDLLIVVPNFKSRGADFPGGGARPGGIATGGSSGELKSGTPEEVAQNLINIITSQIEPESWAVNGGKGTIAYFRGKLVVRNNLIVHEMIGGPEKKKPAPKVPPSPEK